MPEPLFLYSTNTWLAYIISQRFYGDIHYVWCTPYFDSRSLPAFGYGSAPTSSPRDIFHLLAYEVSNGDRHSGRIKENKVGILKGASHKRSIGAITEEQEKEITAILEVAEIRDFKPLVYVMPFGSVKKLAKAVPVKDRAHPLSVEYIIEALPRHYFDVLEL